MTVIILLILAGISIASLTGNGLFEKAKLAKEKQENAQVEEDETLTNYENLIDKKINASRETYKVTRKVIAENVVFEGNQEKQYDIKTVVKDYDKLTDENFAYTCDFYTSIATKWSSRTDSLTYNYNPEDGILTVKSTGLYEYLVYYAYFKNVNIYVYF